MRIFLETNYIYRIRPLLIFSSPELQPPGKNRHGRVLARSSVIAAGKEKRRLPVLFLERTCNYREAPLSQGKLTDAEILLWQNRCRFYRPYRATPRPA